MRCVDAEVLREAQQSLDRSPHQVSGLVIKIGLGSILVLCDRGIPDEDIAADHETQMIWAMARRAPYLDRKAT